jgi:hypothetical protein
MVTISPVMKAALSEAIEGGLRGRREVIVEKILGMLLARAAACHSPAPRGPRWTSTC